MSEPKVCLKCKEIITFCECDESITDKDDYIEYLKQQVKLFATPAVVPSLPKIRVHYATEFGGQITTLELDELTLFINRFKILSLNWQ